MDGPNKPLLGATTVFSALQGWRVPAYMLSPLILLVVVVVAKIALDLFLHTGIGLGMRAAGANPAMAEANGVNVGRMKLLALGIANALTAFAGALFAQIFGAADVQMGIGVIIVGLASVIVGMAILPARTVVQTTFACLVGALLYRFAVALALNADFLGLKTSDLQIVTAVLVTLTLMSQSSRSGLRQLLRRKPR
jgi:putative tryptophan/tyrosine transport system permease protein